MPSQLPSPSNCLLQVQLVYHTLTSTTNLLQQRQPWNGLMSVTLAPSMKQPTQDVAVGKHRITVVQQIWDRVVVATRKCLIMAAETPYRLKKNGLIMEVEMWVHLVWAAVKISHAMVVAKVVENVYHLTIKMTGMAAMTPYLEKNLTLEAAENHRSMEVETPCLGKNLQDTMSLTAHLPVDHVMYHAMKNRSVILPTVHQAEST